MKGRTYILLSVPDNFAKKMLGSVHNLNILNSEKEPPIKIEEVYKLGEPEIAAVPKKPKNEKTGG